ncbi:MAG: hypothetical protein ACREYE_22730 [Gammaproteobacteria bacterium]
MRIARLFHQIGVCLVKDRSTKTSSDQRAADVLPRKKFTLSGYVEAINGEAISGWACNKADLSEFVQVHIQIDAVAVEAVVADRPRPDVAQAGARHSRRNKRAQQDRKR